ADARRRFECGWSNARVEREGGDDDDERGAHGEGAEHVHLRELRSIAGLHDVDPRAARNVNARITSARVDAWLGVERVHPRQPGKPPEADVASHPRRAMLDRDGCEVRVL